MSEKTNPAESKAPATRTHTVYVIDGVVYTEAEYLNWKMMDPRERGND